MNRPAIGSAYPDLQWVPADGCILPTAERPLRVAAFDRLFEEALVGAELVAAAGGTRGSLTLAGGQDLARRVQVLVDAETSCCSFFTFHVIEQSMPASDGPGPTSHRVRVDVTVPPARRDVLQALVDRARVQAGLPTTSAVAD